MLHMVKTIKYKKINKLNDEDFKRITGVTKETFKLMAETLRKHYKRNIGKGGGKSTHTPSNLSTEMSSMSIHFFIQNPFNSFIDDGLFSQFPSL
jgi:hypothetical protein